MVVEFLYKMASTDKRESGKNGAKISGILYCTLNESISLNLM